MLTVQNCLVKGTFIKELPLLISLYRLIKTLGSTLQTIRICLHFLGEISGLINLFNTYLSQY